MNPNPQSSTTDGAPNCAQQVLTFCLGGETYGVDILRVQELRGWAAVTHIPQSPAHVLGVLNLRGSIVPIVDLRIRFSLDQAQFTPLTVIVVLSVLLSSGRREVGLVVDSVSDVVDIGSADLKETPALGSKVSPAFIRGLATVADRMLILLDVDELIRRDIENVETRVLEGAA